MRTRVVLAKGMLSGSSFLLIETKETFILYNLGFWNESPLHIFSPPHKEAYGINKEVSEYDLYETAEALFFNFSGN